MKVAVIGYGHVGMAVFSELLHMREIHELVLVGRNQEKIRGELSDYLDSMALTGIRTKIDGGGYDKLKGADIIVYAVGVPVSAPGISRLELRYDAVKLARSVSEEINKYNSDAIIIAISNPVDVIVQALQKYTGRPRQKVIGTGTLLDTARLKRSIAELFGISPSNIDGYILGEHGDSSCILWSRLKILGMTVDEFLSGELCESMNIRRDIMHEYNRLAGHKIIEQKGHTCYGVAAVSTKIISAIIFDSNEIMPVSVMLNGEYGIDGLAFSMPCRINRTGATIMNIGELTDDELQALHASAEVVRAASECIES